MTSKFFIEARNGCERRRSSHVVHIGRAAVVSSAAPSHRHMTGTHARQTAARRDDGLPHKLPHLLVLPFQCFLLHNCVLDDCIGDKNDDSG